MSTRVNPDGALRRTRIACVLIGVASLVLKRHYGGPGQDLVMSYGGNLSASFAVYFMFAASVLGVRGGGWVPTVLAVAVVELFEITDGFGVMSNVYDPFDLVANVTGIALAWACDAVLRRAGSSLEPRRR